MASLRPSEDGNESLPSPETLSELSLSQPSSLASQPNDLASRLFRLASLVEGVDDEALRRQVEVLEGQVERPGEMSVQMLRDALPEDSHLYDDSDGDDGHEMTIRQANRIIHESTKLNDELAAVVENLKARQEESDHIHGLLIERAERAAQRILFLQNRISYLESELRENDEELQYLRICLKAVEVQMPPHPDPELARCIATFKEDYRALKEKRARTKIQSP